MGLWAVIMDTLHAIASHARELEAAYVHTDGYILPERNANYLLEIIQSYGLYAGIKARGVGTVIGMGNWRVGEHQTMNYGKNFALMGGVDYTYQTPREQLQRKLKHYQESLSIYATRQQNQVVRE